jgi:hypothetical protein
VAAVLALGVAASSASAANVGVSGAQILSVEQGSRGVGMGDAYVSVVDDVDSLWWNPAGLARDTFSEATLTHTVFLQNTATDYLGFIRPVPQLNGTLGASLTYLSIPGVQGFDSSGNPTSNLSAYGYVGTISYGSQPIDGFTFGATGKYITQTYASETGSGFAADLGAQYWQDNWGLAAVIQNIGPSYSIGGVSDPLPRDIRVGGYYKVLSDRVTLSLDEELPYDQNGLAHVGAEWRLSQGVQLRLGVEQTSSEGPGAGVTAGFSIATAVGGKPAAAAPRDRSATGKSYEDMDAMRSIWDHLGGGEDFHKAVQDGAYIVGIDYAFTTLGTIGEENRISLTVRF